MARQLPKNVRQIGNVSDSSKIYIEDYVDTFFNQLCEKASAEMVGAFLIGETVQEEENDYIYVSGAIKMQELGVKGKDFIVEEKVWKNACETCKEYFGNAEILGWFITGGEHSLEVNHNIHKIHQKYFPREKSIFVTKNSRDKEEKFYVYKYRDMMECKGHFIYYEKNTEMQNYMISCRKNTGVTPSEVIEDRAAKSFRNIIQDKMEQNEQKSNSRLVYAMSAILVLVVMVIGVASMNNYEKMKNISKTPEETTQQSVAKEDEDVVETLGQVSEEDKQGTIEGSETEGELQEETEEPQTETETKEPQTESEEPQTETGEPQAETKEPQTETEESQSGIEEEEEVVETVSGIQTEEIYIVEKGDTLASISKKVYGDISHVDDICELNGLEDGNLIMIGQKLLLP